MSLRRSNPALAVSALLVASMLGCASTGRSPFAFRPTRAQNVVASEVATAAQPATADDAVSKTIAAESQALSDQFSVSSDPELAKYASASSDAGTYGPSSTRAVNPTYNSPRSSSGCTSGCCSR